MRVQSGDGFLLPVSNGSGIDFSLVALSAACFCQMPARCLKLAIVWPRGNLSSCWAMGVAMSGTCFRVLSLWIFNFNFELDFLNTFYTHTAIHKNLKYIIFLKKVNTKICTYCLIT